MLIHLVFAGGVTNRPRVKRLVFANEMIGWSGINVRMLNAGQVYPLLRKMMNAHVSANQN